MRSVEARLLGSRGRGTVRSQGQKTPPLPRPAVGFTCLGGPLTQHWNMKTGETHDTTANSDTGHRTQTARTGTDVSFTPYLHHSNTRSLRTPSRVTTVHNQPQTRSQRDRQSPRHSQLPPCTKGIVRLSYRYLLERKTVPRTFWVNRRVSFDQLKLIPVPSSTGLSLHPRLASLPLSPGHSLSPPGPGYPSTQGRGAGGRLRLKEQKRQSPPRLLPDEVDAGQGLGPSVGRALGGRDALRVEVVGVVPQGHVRGRPAAPLTRGGDGRFPGEVAPMKRRRQTRVGLHSHDPRLWVPRPVCRRGSSRPPLDPRGVGHGPAPPTSTEQRPVGHEDPPVPINRGRTSFTTLPYPRSDQTGAPTRTSTEH